MDSLLAYIKSFLLKVKIFSMIILQTVKFY